MREHLAAAHAKDPAAAAAALAAEEIQSFQDLLDAFLDDSDFLALLKGCGIKTGTAVAIKYYCARFVGEYGDDTGGRRLSVSHPNHPVNSFIGKLEDLVKAEDFVAVKLDIDTPSAELVIMEAIAESPEIAALIDELYFEYHFDFDGINFGWGEQVSGDVDTALGLMRRLRELGVRSHFWI